MVRSSSRRPRSCAGHPHRERRSPARGRLYALGQGDEPLRGRRRARRPRLPLLAHSATVLIQRRQALPAAVVLFPGHGHAPVPLPPRPARDRPLRPQGSRVCLRRRSRGLRRGESEAVRQGGAGGCRRAARIGRAQRTGSAPGRALFDGQGTSTRQSSTAEQV